MTFCVLNNFEFKRTGSYGATLYCDNCTLNNIYVPAYHNNQSFGKLNNSIIYNCSNLDLGLLNIFNQTSDYNCINGTIRINGVVKTLNNLQSDYPTSNQNSIDDNPLFNNESLNNFTLQSTSPCIGGASPDNGTAITIGAKNEAKSITAQTLITNADSTINCELNASNNIIISQHDLNFPLPQPSSTEVILQSSASAVDDYYNGLIINIIDGTGVGEYRTITDYIGSTRTATLDSAITVAVSSFYSIEMELESENIYIGKAYISDMFNLNGFQSITTKYGSDDKSKILFKWADTEADLATADYEDFTINSPLLYDTSNTVGIGNENYVSGEPFGMVWIKIKIRAQIKV